MGDRRFDRAWVRFDSRLKAGENMADILATMTTAQLADLLAADAGRERAFERNVIATAIQNRLTHRRPETPQIRATAMAIVSAARTASDTQKLVKANLSIRRASADMRTERALDESARRE